MKTKSSTFDSKTIVPGFIMGQSPSSRRFIKDLLKLAPLFQPVLLRGETGTGKELAAQLVHRFSSPPPSTSPSPIRSPSSRASRLPRQSIDSWKKTGASDLMICEDKATGVLEAQLRSKEEIQRPFIAVNCAAVPESLAESELFGHCKGAFTGAVRHHRGAFSRADGGTLFLDEIGELPAHIQAKLLRVLETGRIQVVGEDVEQCVQVRVVAATHRDLEKMILDGSFREDLYHRLAVFEVEIPPLRARRQDIASLLEYFAEQCSRELKKQVRFDKGAISAAMDYPWPGNVRSLRNAVVRAAVFGADPILAEDLLPRSDALSSHACLQIPRGSYAKMKRAMLSAVLAETGSIRRAAKVLEIPRSTLGSWLRDASV